MSAGVPVRSLMVQHRTLEEIVLDVTGAGSDQFSVATAESGESAGDTPAAGSGDSAAAMENTESVTTAEEEIP